MTARTQAEIMEKLASGVIDHVNADHGAELLTLGRAFGDHSWATDAEMLRVDLGGMDLLFRDGTREEGLRVLFEPPLARANHVRKGFMALLDRAHTLLGEEPATDDEEGEGGRALGLSDVLYRYVLDASVREPDVARRLREVTELEDEGDMQIGPEQAQFLSLLLKLIGARRTLEVGVFTGYSTLWTALALPDDGEVIACDVSEEWTNIGRPFWQEAGVAHKIDLRLAPALETLAALLADGQARQFDFAFLDAEKTEYDQYYEQCLQLLRPGGLIAIDNVLWGGAVAEEDEQDETIVSLRALNAKLHADERIDLSLLPLGDGLTLARKR